MESSMVIPSWSISVEASLVISFFDLDNPIVSKSKTRWRSFPHSACSVSPVLGSGRVGNHSSWCDEGSPTFSLEDSQGSEKWSLQWLFPHGQ